MQSCNLRSKHFFADDEVAQISLGIVTVNERSTFLINRGEIIFPFFIPDIDDAISGEQHAVAGIACRHYTIEHVDAKCNAFKDIGRCSNAHEVAWLFEWKNVAHQFSHFIHHFSRFTYRQSANGISIAILFSNIPGRNFSKIAIHTSLYNREKGLFMPVFWLCGIEMIDAACQPAMCHLHAFFCIAVFTWIRCTLIKGHNDVSAYCALYIHHIFRCEKVP